jgi:hypothetical protein
MPSLFPKHFNKSFLQRNYSLVEERSQDPFDEDYSIKALHDEAAVPLTSNESPDAPPRYDDKPQHPQKLMYCLNITLFCFSLILFSFSRFESPSSPDQFNNTLIRGTSKYCWSCHSVSSSTGQLTQSSTNSGSSPYSARNYQEKWLVQPKGSALYLPSGSKPRSRPCVEKAVEHCYHTDQLCRCFEARCRPISNSSVPRAIWLWLRRTYWEDRCLPSNSLLGNGNPSCRVSCSSLTLHRML